MFSQNESESRTLLPTTISRIITTARSLITNYIIEWWLLEILSWCFSAVCMIAIFIVFLKFDDETQPKFPLGITINGFISVFSVCAKAALILPTAEGLGQLKWSHFKEKPRPLMDIERIDLASRGPYGAILLLGRARRMPLLALGAAVIMFAVPLDFVFQQTISYPVRWVQADNAFVPRSVAYDSLGGVFFKNNTRRLGPINSMIATLEPLWMGLNSSRGGTLPQLKGTCPTGNCTWEPFETLAVCSKCVDLSQELQWECATEPSEWVSNATYAGRPYPNVTSCGFSLKPDGKTRVFLSGYVVGADGSKGEALSTRFFPLVDSAPLSRAASFNGSVHFRDILNPISDFFVSGTPQGEIGAWGNATPTVLECNLHWCVKTVNTTHSWGRLNETTTRTVELDSPKTGVGSAWIKFDMAGVMTPRWIANFSLTLPPRQQEDLRNNSFSVINQTMVETILAMDQFLPSYVTTKDTGSTPYYRWLNGGQFFGETPLVVDLPVITNPWLPPNNITAQVEQIADTMTVVLRNAANSTSEFQWVRGTAWNEQTFIHIRWAWAIWPILLLALSLVFLIMTVAKSSREENVVRIWKNSAIAILFNGPGEEVKKSVEANARLGKARAKARTLWVRLFPD
ncbi:hypothetical protein EG328_011876 [Venturia inaequalis]|uniref:Uncharacterized protein n=1 Tax=Venturia inaequalis TaxID=5025 RepID=A0A8H3V658_VENIN|nr:hypothetical protein EG328_011876 [Venturia inaequalis]